MGRSTCSQSYGRARHPPGPSACAGDPARATTRYGVGANASRTMNRESSPRRRIQAGRWLIPAAIVLALAAAPPAAADVWQIEPIGASEGVYSLHDLDFDSQGRGLLSWAGALQGRVPPIFGGLALRDPAGGWTRPPDLGGLEPVSAQVHLFSDQRALLVARAGTRRRVVVADGRSDGGFGPRRTLAEFVAATWSASNVSGDAIVAWKSERLPFVTVSERTDGHGFGKPRDLALARSASVAINERGDRVFAFPAGRRIGVRTRLAGKPWGPIVRFGNLPVDRDRRLTALITNGGRIVITWGREGGPCGVAVRANGRWRSRRLEQRCGPATTQTREAPVMPFADSAGATYVAWTHHTARANSVTLARLGARGPVGPSVVSRQRGAILDDVAAGPERAIAITWGAVLSPAGAPPRAATYAAVRRGTSPFTVDRLSPANVLVARGSRVAFQPLTGQVVVAIPYRVGRTFAVGAAVSARPAPP
jgi:hypothetical protein